MRRKNSELRSREYLFPEEVTALLEAAKLSPRHPNRNYTLILVGYQHGLRVQEAHNLRWSQVDFSSKKLHVNRIKRGQPSIHPLISIEITALYQLKLETGENKTGRIFLSERNQPLSIRSMQYIVEIAGRNAGFSFPAHFHMLRHSCGFYLANKGIDTRAIQDYLGHTNIMHTVGYTKLVSSRFDNFFE
ncbi:MAG: tyrosine-type recombinase/integrase [Candidatus Marithrix sp.]|nr:tyrosine-type recombinase/integrase [Candidatus Marithrix sp.]